MRCLRNLKNSYSCLRFPSHVLQPPATRYLTVTPLDRVWQPHRRKKGAGMNHDSLNTQPPPPITQSTFSSSRWLIVAVAFCGALAGGSIVEVVATVASGTSISFSPDHLIAGPLALVGAICGGLLAAIVASTDNSSRDQNDPMTADSFARTDIIPAEPLMWQPTPAMPPLAGTLASTNMPSTRSKRRLFRIHRRAYQVVHPYYPGRLAFSRSSTTMDRPRHRGVIHHAHLSEKEADAG